MKTPASLGLSSFETPLGWLAVAESALGIALVHFFGPQRPTGEEIAAVVRKEYPGALIAPPGGAGLCESARAHILGYLEAGIPIPPIPVDLSKGTPFDLKVWKAISDIPFGQTMSYARIARNAGAPLAARAAGGACGRNPVPLLVPCHRVVASNGTLGGFSGGLHIKRALLDLERNGPGLAPAGIPATELEGPF